jgi:hypothetical protein
VARAALGLPPQGAQAALQRRDPGGSLEAAGAAPRPLLGARDRELPPRRLPGAAHARLPAAVRRLRAADEHGPADAAPAHRARARSAPADRGERASRVAHGGHELSPGRGRAEAPRRGARRHRRGRPALRELRRHQHAHAPRDARRGSGTSSATRASGCSTSWAASTPSPAAPSAAKTRWRTARPSTPSGERATTGSIRTRRSSSATRTTTRASSTACWSSPTSGRAQGGVRDLHPVPGHPLVGSPLAPRGGSSTATGRSTTTPTWSSARRR